MPNWCSTEYVIDGDAKEVKQLYELMKGLEERETPSVENGFGAYSGGYPFSISGDIRSVPS